MKLHFIVGFCAALAACSSTEEAQVPAASVQDAAVDAPAESSSPDSSSADAPPDDSSFADSSSPDTSSTDAETSFETCENACTMTELALTFGSNEAVVDRAQFGFNAPDNGKVSLHVEAHFGGDPACPTGASPSPDRTVIFANVPIPTDSTPIENAAVTLLDFEGTLSPNPFDSATSATLSPVAAKPTPTDDAFIAFDVNATFDGGTMTGHIYAVHCDSMDE